MHILIVRDNSEELIDVWELESRHPLMDEITGNRFAFDGEQFENLEGKVYVNNKEITDNDDNLPEEHFGDKNKIVNNDVEIYNLLLSIVNRNIKHRNLGFPIKCNNYSTIDYLELTY